MVLPKNKLVFASKIETAFFGHIYLRLMSECCLCCNTNLCFNNAKRYMATRKELFRAARTHYCRKAQIIFSTITIEKHQIFGICAIGDHVATYE